MSGSEKVKLLGVWGSPFSRRVELALRLKGVAYEYKEEDLHNKSALLIESNPVYKQVPVLIHGGKAIPESLIAVEYVDEAWEGYPLLPKDLLEKAKARFWAKFIDDKVLPSLWMSCWTMGDAQKNFIEQAKENLDILEAELKEKKFFGGESIGIADIAANFLSIWADVLQEMAGISILTQEKHPILWRWSLDFLGSEVVKECTPDRQKLLGMFRAQKAAKSSA